jgi:hypothetical protein
MIEEGKMLRIQPISITAAGKDKYLVRFSRGDEEVEYTFTMDDAGVRGVKWEHDFWVATHDDPAADKLLKAILLFD